jgi:hypothetical protein
MTGYARLGTGGPVWRTTLNKVLVLIPVLVLAAGFVVFCEVDLARADEVRFVPKWVWAIRGTTAYFSSTSNCTLIAR